MAYVAEGGKKLQNRMGGTLNERVAAPGEWKKVRGWKMERKDGGLWLDCGLSGWRVVKN